MLPVNESEAVEAFIEILKRLHTFEPSTREVLWRSIRMQAEILEFRLQEMNSAHKLT